MNDVLDKQLTKKIENLYELLETLEHEKTQEEYIASLKWAIFELERKYNIVN